MYLVLASNTDQLGPMMKKSRNWPKNYKYPLICSKERSVENRKLDLLVVACPDVLVLLLIALSILCYSLEFDLECYLW